MARVVCIHGIAQEYETKETLLQTWAPALCGGVGLAGGILEPRDVTMAAYGAIFRPAGKGEDILDLTAGDLNAFELQLLADFAEGAEGTVDQNVKDKSEFFDKFRRTPASMLELLARTPYFGDIAQKIVIWFLQQVRFYLTEPKIREELQRTLISAVTQDTSVIVGHSLGSVVAYEVLCARPDLPVHTLVTLGSPLGVKAILPRLIPAVLETPGRWPSGLQKWFNIADVADIVALEKKLSRVYGDRVQDSVVYNGATMHNVKPYLTAKETGDAIRTGLEFVRAL